MKKTYIIIALGLLSHGIGYAGESDRVAIETIILEAQGEPYVGQVLVAETIRNRARKAKVSAEAVCLSPWQFSCWNERQDARKRLSRASGEAWQRASRAWAESEEPRTKVTHYHNLSVWPKWARGKEPAYRIGSHMFYEDIK